VRNAERPERRTKIHNIFPDPELQECRFYRYILLLTLDYIAHANSFGFCFIFYTLSLVLQLFVHYCKIYAVLSCNLLTGMTLFRILLIFLVRWCVDP